MISSDRNPFRLGKSLLFSFPGKTADRIQKIERCVGTQYTMIGTVCNIDFVIINAQVTGSSQWCSKRNSIHLPRYPIGSRRFQCIDTATRDSIGKRGVHRFLLHLRHTRRRRHRQQQSGGGSGQQPHSPCLQQMYRLLYSLMPEDAIVSRILV